MPPFICFAVVVVVVFDLAWYRARQVSFRVFAHAPVLCHGVLAREPFGSRGVKRRRRDACGVRLGRIICSLHRPKERFVLGVLNVCFIDGRSEENVSRVCRCDSYFSQDRS